MRTQSLRQGWKRSLVVNVHSSGTITTTLGTAPTTATASTIPTIPTASAISAATASTTVRPIKACVDFDINFLLLFCAGLGCGFGLQTLCVTRRWSNQEVIVPCQQSRPPLLRSSCVQQYRPKPRLHLHWPPGRSPA